MSETKGQLVTVWIDGQPVEMMLYITGGDAPYGMGYLGEDGIMHEFVKEGGTDRILKERHTPMGIWNNLANHPLPDPEES